MAINKFLLLGLNVTVLMILGIYLMNLFNVRGYDNITLVYLFAAALIVTVLANEFIEKFKISNPVYFIIPGLLAAAAPFILGRPISAAIALGWLLLAPGIVLLVRSMLEKKKE